MRAAGALAGFSKPRHHRVTCTVASWAESSWAGPPREGDVLVSCGVNGNVLEQGRIVSVRAVRRRTPGNPRVVLAVVRVTELQAAALLDDGARELWCSR